MWYGIESVFWHTDCYISHACEAIEKDDLYFGLRIWNMSVVWILSTGMSWGSDWINGTEPKMTQRVRLGAQ